MIDDICERQAERKRNEQVYGLWYDEPSNTFPYRDSLIRSGMVADSRAHLQMKPAVLPCKTLMPLDNERYIRLFIIRPWHGIDKVGEPEPLEKANKNQAGNKAPISL